MAISSTSFKTGQSGNPQGRAKGFRDKRQFFNEQLMLSYHDSGDALRVMEVIKNHALEGNMKACKLFCEYVFFKPEANLTINHAGTNNEIDNDLTPQQIEQIKKIAEITLSSSDESE